MKIFNDERASSVMFATLMLILIVITVGSAFAFTLSLNQKQYMERQSALTSQQNENLKIISIKPYPNEMNQSYWAGFDFTIFNGDINDADIKAISVNDKFMIDRFVYNGKGGMELYNGSRLIDVPAGQAINIHVGDINWTEELNNATSTIQESPDLKYPDIDCSGCWNITDSNGVEISNSSYVVSNNTMPPILIPANTSYPFNISYTMFPNNELYPAYSPNDIFLRKNPVKVELLTQRVNLFSKVFSPPNPIANAQTMSTSNPTISNLILDASGSTAPNGFITNYMWEFTNGTPLGWDYANTTTFPGIKNSKLIDNTLNYSIDLIVTDNYGMSSDLSERTGNITIG